MSKSSSSVLALMASGALFAGPAFAQATPSVDPGATAPARMEADAGDEADAGAIVVTARKLGETAQNAPATITVLDDAQLAHKGVVSATQLDGVIPGVVQMNGVGGLPATSFRGVGSNSSLFGVESSVPMYQDNVYLGRLRDFLAPVYDVDHVEFIKGTQSTLLGKNSTLGAISFVNRRPRNEFGYTVSYEHTFNVDGDHLDAALNLPVSDTLSIRMAGLYDDDDGYVTNLITDRVNTNTRVLSGRISARYEPTDAVDFFLSYQHDDRRQRGQDLEVLKDPIGSMQLRQRAVGQTEFDNRADRNNTFGSQAFGTAAAAREPYDLYIANRLNLIANVELDSGMTFTSQSAYVSWGGGYLADLDFTRVALFNLEDEQSSRQFTQEIRLSSPSDARLKYLVGAFYYKNIWTLERVLTGASPTGLIPNQPTASPSQGVFGGTVGFYDNRHRMTTESISPFASLTFDVTDTFNVSGGVRHTWESKDAFYSRTSAGFIGTILGPPIAPQTLSRSERSFDYNVGAQWFATPELMLYGSYSKGSKSGGFQEIPVILSAAEYKGEKATTAEAGAKYNLPGSFNAAVALFETKIDGFQANFTLPVGGVPVSNVGNVGLRTRGVEFNAAARPLDGLNLSASAVYADSQFTSFLAGTTVANAVIFPGQRAPRAPKFTAQLDGNYTMPVADSMEVTLGATISHVSETLLNNQNFNSGDAPRTRPHQNLNLRMALADKQAGWEVALVGDNVLDQQWTTFATRIPGDVTPTVATPALGQRSYYGTVNRPRTVALRLTLTR